MKRPSDGEREGGVALTLMWRNLGYDENLMWIFFSLSMPHTNSYIVHQELTALPENLIDFQKILSQNVNVDFSLCVLL